MAGGIGNLMELQGKTDVNGALVIAIATVVPASGASSDGGVNVLPELQGKVTADDELVVRFA